MYLTIIKKILPHFLAIIVFLLVSVIYCKPVLNGNIVNQSDIIGYKGMVQQSFEYNEKNGHYPLWTESMFSGMPAYSIGISPTINSSLNYISSILTLGLPKPISFFFLASICFYILCLVLKIDPLIGTLTSLAYAWSSYDAIIVLVGHETKMLAIAYLPAIIAGMIFIFQRKYLWGLLMFLIFFSLQVSTQHLQIIYYTIIIMGVFSICFFIHSYHEKNIKEFMKSLSLIIISGIISFASAAIFLLPMHEYTKETMRGGRTELVVKNSTDGLKKDYAFQWSYGIGETFTLFVPNIYGGGSGRQLTDGNDFSDKLEHEFGYTGDNSLQIESSVMYWGGQELGTAGPVYVGVVICLLFILSIFYLKGYEKHWLISISILGIILAWGKHFPIFNDFIFDYLPYYNKFRAPTMALVLVQFAFPMLAALGLQKVLDSKELLKEHWVKLKKVAIIVSGVLVLLTAYYFMTDYKSAGDEQLKESIINGRVKQYSLGSKTFTVTMQQEVLNFSSDIMKSLREARKTLFGMDLLRVIFFIGLTTLLIYLFLKKKINRFVLLLGLIITSSYDLLSIDKQYLNDNNFIDPLEYDHAFNLTPADIEIKRDTTKSFRVMDLIAEKSWASDSRTSYFFNTIGGYHPAKLGLYQDLIDSQLNKGNIKVYNMLNTRYFIQQSRMSKQPVATYNKGAFGPCWLVKDIHYVKDGKEELKALDSTDTRNAVIIQNKYKNLISFESIKDSVATIKLLFNHNDTIDYAFSSKTNQFAVFSEVYYPDGWNVFVDNKLSTYYRVDYLLRGMIVPAGKHKIEFRFEPYSYKLGKIISIVATIIIWFIVIVVILFKKKEFTL